MPSYSSKSKMKLAQAHPDLQRLFNEVIKHVDITIVQTARTIDEQTENVKKGVSKTMNSKHLKMPSEAVDWVPYPRLDYNDTERFYYIAGIIRGIAYQLDIPVINGADWDDDGEVKDQRFFDLGHTELKGE